MEAQVAECIKTMQDAMELLQEQAAKGNEKFVERFISSNKANYTLLAEVKKRRNKRTIRGVMSCSSRAFLRAYLHVAWRPKEDWPKWLNNSSHGSSGVFCSCTYRQFCLRGPDKKTLSKNNIYNIDRTFLSST
jgi:hypothetical protein